MGHSAGGAGGGAGLLVITTSVSAEAAWESAETADEQEVAEAHSVPSGGLRRGWRSGCNSSGT